MVAVDGRLVGGERPCWGCVPSKMMIERADLLAASVHAEVPTARLRKTIFAYPTFHRAVEVALDDLSG